MWRGAASRQSRCTRLSIAAHPLRDGGAGDPELARHLCLWPARGDLPDQLKTRDRRQPSVRMRHEGPLSLMCCLEHTQQLGRSLLLSTTYLGTTTSCTE